MYNSYNIVLPLSGFVQFRRHLLQSLLAEQQTAWCGSPDLGHASFDFKSGSPDLVEAAGIVVTVQDVNNIHEKEAQDKERGADEDTATLANCEGTCTCTICMHTYIYIILHMYTSLNRIQL